MTSGQRGPRRARGVALGASLLVHGALVLLAIRWAPRAAAPAPDTTPIEVTVEEAPAPAPPVFVGPPAPPADRAPPPRPATPGQSGPRAPARSATRTPE